MKVEELYEWMRHPYDCDAFAGDPEDEDCDCGLAATLAEFHAFAPLPTSAPSRGPRTSQAAADSVWDLKERHLSVYQWLLEDGPMTDEELADTYGVARAVDVKQTPQSLRTRRHELVQAGHVRYAGYKRPVRTGRDAMVWEAV